MQAAIDTVLRLWSGHKQIILKETSTTCQSQPDPADLHPMYCNHALVWDLCYTSILWVWSWKLFISGDTVGATCMGSKGFLLQTHPSLLVSKSQGISIRPSGEHRQTSLNNVFLKNMVDNRFILLATINCYLCLVSQAITYLLWHLDLTYDYIADGSPVFRRLEAAIFLKIYIF